LYTTEVDGQGRVYWVPFDGVGIPVDLLEAGLGALNEVAWSPDGQWAAFGAGGSGLAYVFHTSEPLNLAQIGDTSPYLEFSPTSDVLLNLRGSELDLIQLTGPGQVSLTTITSGSPAHFSDDGAYVYYVDAGGTGILRGWDGSALTSIHEVDGFSHVCPLTWTGPSRFVYQRCATEERGLAEGVIDGGELTTVTHAGSLLANLVIGPAQRCFVNWESDRLDVGTTQLPLVTEFTRVAPGAITHAALASRDNAVVWVEEGTDVYWLPLSSSCTVSTLPELVASGATVQSLRFVSEWP
jgi:WD40 repeat protein